MFGEHAPFIIPAYIITVLALVSITLWIAFTWRNRKRELARLEETTDRSRSSKKTSQ